MELFEAISTAAFRAADRVFLECMRAMLEQKDRARENCYGFMEVGGRGKRQE